MAKVYFCPLCDEHGEHSSLTPDVAAGTASCEQGHDFTLKDGVLQATFFWNLKELGPDDDEGEGG